MSSIKEWVRCNSVRDSLLPAPVNQYVQEKKVEAPKVVEKKVYNIPPYGQRANYIPRRREDYGDGGAFPEIHIAQYPLDMGRSEGTGDTKVVAVATDENGNSTEAPVKITVKPREETPAEETPAEREKPSSG